MNKTIRIKGGIPLSGQVTIAPNKNAILPALIASILTDDVMTYKEVPESPDVKKILAALEKMGAVVTNKNAIVSICCKNLATSVVPNEIIKEMQAGYLFAGPLLVRFGEATVPPSLGCQLGYRGYHDHAEYLKKMGIEVSLIEVNNQKYVHFKNTAKKEDLPIVAKHNSDLYKNRRISYTSPFVTPTENILMFLAGNSCFDTEVSGIAQEPHVAQLIDLLRNMGVQIKGKGSTIKIRNCCTLKGATFIPGPDHVDYFGFVITAAMTKSDIELLLHVDDNIQHMNEIIISIGIELTVGKHSVTVLGSKSSFKPSSTFPRAHDANTYKMNPAPWPGFPIDCLPSFIAWSTLNQDPETSTASNNWMYDDGIKYVPVMRQMGARIPYFDLQRVTTTGTEQSPYRSSLLEVSAPDVIEGVRALISCALSGGEYIIKNVQYILRRNPLFFEVLKKLGADIEVL
jgi:UDP-N-acetylglucosamine 1-carboxyvinyltransferase